MYWKYCKLNSSSGHNAHVVVVDKWPLIGGCCRHVVAVLKWSLPQVWLFAKAFLKKFKGNKFSIRSQFFCTIWLCVYFTDLWQTFFWCCSCKVSYFWLVSHFVQTKFFCAKFLSYIQFFSISIMFNLFFWQAWNCHTHYLNNFFYFKRIGSC
jgi:hypothetical protein